MATIVLIEDDASIRRALCRILTSAGHQVFETPDGKQGFEAVQQHSPDLVLTDILMPEQDGFEVIHQIQSQCPNVKIVVISGSGPDFLGMARDFGANAAIAKPFKSEAVLRIVQDLLQGSGPGGRITEEEA